MTGFFRSLFGSKKPISKIKPRMQSRRLELLGLEERITPATISVETPGGSLARIVKIQLGDGEDITNLNTTVNGSVITINTVGSSQNTYTGSDPGLTVNAASIVVDTGTGGFVGFSGFTVLGFDDTSSTDFNTVTVGATGIDLSNAPGFANQLVRINLTQGNDNDVLNVNGPIKSKGEGDVGLAAGAGSSSLVIGDAGDITASAGSVGISSFNLSSSGDVTTDSGGINFQSNLILTGNININSTSGNVSFTSISNGNGKNLTINSGSGRVTSNGSAWGFSSAALGNLTVTTTNTSVSPTNSAISLAGVNAGAVSLTGAGDISVSGAITAASVNAKSTAGDVIFANTVTTTQVGGFISSTPTGKSTSIANVVSSIAAISITGDLTTTNNNAQLITSGTSSNLSITGSIKGTGSDLLLQAENGTISVGGSIGSGGALGNFSVRGKDTFSVVGSVNAASTNVGSAGYIFSNKVEFLDTVGVSNINGFRVTTQLNGTISLAKAVTATNNSPIVLLSAGGKITLAADISSGSGHIFVETDTGDITTKGISTSGSTARIEIDTVTSGNVTINGNVSTSGGGNILLGSASRTGNMTINGTVSTTGSSTSGDIFIGSGGTGTITVNKALSTGTANTTPGAIYLIALGNQINTINFSKDATITSANIINFRTTGSTNTISFASGANITSAGDVTDSSSGPGNINLASNITTSNGLISFNNVSVNLAGAVSMKAGGQAGNINLGNTNGAQNLTLETTGNIVASSSTAIGGLTPLNSLTVVNSANSVFLDLNSASVVLSDTTGSIGFDGNTVISKSLTTTTEGYSVSFINGKTAVISGAPVFLNTGNVIMQGTTSLPGGATITGGTSTNANLAGTIVSGGAFNIGSGISSINISDNTQLILNSTSAVSTFASPISLNAQQAGVFKLLGVGNLTLSADSTAGVTTNDSISVINGTLNVTGKLGNASLTSLTSGTITGAGGTIGALTVNTGTVAPGGTLNTGAITLNAATNYNAAILTNTTASNLKTSSAINLNGANLALSSIPNGLIVGNVFTIIDNTATQTGINGTFAGLPEGSSVSAKDASGNTIAFTISYKGGTNTNDVTLTVASITPSQTATPQPMVAGEPVLNKFTAFGADAGGGPLVTITFANGTYTSFFAYDPAFRGGVRVALGDVNADGTPEVITGAGAGGGPQVNVYSVNPFSGAVSLQSSFYAFSDASFSGGVYVAAGRTNSDAFDDIIVGAGAGGGPRVQVYAGSPSGVVTSSTLIDFFAYATEFTGGVVVAAGDRTGDGVDQVITAPASNGGWNIKSFYVTGTINNPLVIDNFFAFNNTTSVGGLSLAVGYLNSGSVADLIIGTTNGGYGVIINYATSGIAGVPFSVFTGAIRAGVAEDSTGKDYAVALAGPTGDPLVVVYEEINNFLVPTDDLFVINPSFTGGLFGTPTIADNVI